MYLKVKQELEKHHQKKKYLNFTLGFFGLKNNNPNFLKGQLPFLSKERIKGLSLQLKEKQNQASQPARA